MEIVVLILVFLFGISVGSFLNVVIYRVPRGENLIFSRSKCPHCGHRLAWNDMVPIISFVVLKGRCRYCGGKISPLYPFVEFITGLWTLWVFLYLFEKDPYLFVEVLVFGYFAIVLSVIDAQLYILPNKILLSLGIFELFWTFVIVWTNNFNWHMILNRSIGALVLFVFFLVIYYLVPGGMGEGDVKLAPIIGWFLGFPRIVPWFFIAFGMGAVIGLIIMLFSKLISKQTRRIVPFGPFMLVGAILSWFWGIHIIIWYKYLFFR